MDVLIACHCKLALEPFLHNPVIIHDVPTATTYSLIPIEDFMFRRLLGSSERMDSADIQLATPDILLEKFNIRSVSYVETDTDQCEPSVENNQFVKWEDIPDGSMDKIITMYCSSNLNAVDIDRILKPGGDVTFIGNSQRLPAFSQIPLEREFVFTSLSGIWRCIWE